MSEPVNPRLRFLEVDIWRALAICGVILIHIEGGSIHFFQSGSNIFYSFLVIDQLLRYSVPLFVFISGFTLAVGYANDTFNLKVFIKKRLFRILPWYFFFSILIYVYTRFLFVENVPKFPIWELVFLGKTDYHLYFVSMIFQLYLLFPVLLFVFKRNWRLLLISAFLFQSFVYLVSSLNAQGIIRLPFVWYDQQQYVFFGSWIFYFVMGMVFTNQKFELAIGRFKKVVPYISSGLILWAVYDTFRLLRLGDVIIAERSTRIPLLFFTTFLLFTIFCFRDLYKVLPSKVVEFLVHLGKRSYIIYLLHTLVLRIVSKFVMPSNLFNLVLYTVCVFIFSILFAEICAKVAGFLDRLLFHRKPQPVFT